MNSLPLFVKKYLEKYSSNRWKLNGELKAVFKNIVVIPAIDELLNLQRLINSISQLDKKYFNNTLFLFVINNTASSSDEVKLANLESINFLNHNIKLSTGIPLAFIDASSDGNELPEKDGGVGLARKIGMDIALSLFDYADERKNILICLDADCTVSKNYLTSIVDEFNGKDIDAASIYFEHPLDLNEANTPAIICYEIFLRYYVAGLHYSNSPYAFHTIGSSMACTAASYIKAEGMNKRKAAEDFYFLEKLSKSFKIYSINSAAVYPSSRGSWRVPFGTGQRVNRYFAATHDEYTLYSPLSFEVLKQWHSIFFGVTNFTPGEYLSLSCGINEELKNFLTANDFEKSMDKIFMHSKTEEQIFLQKRRWFDGFRTLKLVHHLRDTVYPNQHMFDALDVLFEKICGTKINREDSIPSIETQILYLNELRRLDKL